MHEELSQTIVLLLLNRKTFEAVRSAVQEIVQPGGSKEVCPHQRWTKI